MNYEKKLFDVIDEFGEILNGDLHIIDASDEYPCTAGDRKYRVYHKKGYCFDVEKEFIYDNEDETKGHFEYTFLSEWDGFKKLTVQAAIVLIKINTVIPTRK